MRVKNDKRLEKYVNILTSALQSLPPMASVTNRKILDVVLEDVFGEKNFSQTALYLFLYKGLGKEGIQQLEEALLSISRNYKLIDIVQMIYKYRPHLSPSIVSHLNKDERYFEGKCFELSDPETRELICSEIKSCKIYEEDGSKFFSFSLEHGGVIEMECEQEEVLCVYSAFKEKRNLLDLLSHFGERPGKLPRVEFLPQNALFPEENFRINPGNYEIEVTKREKNGFFKFVKSLGSQDLNEYRQSFILTRLDNKDIYHIVIEANNDRLLRVLFLLNPSLALLKPSLEADNFYEYQEIRVEELSSICFNTLVNKKLFRSINRENASETIFIKDMGVNENKEKMKSLDKINKNREYLLNFLKSEQNEPELESLLNHFLSNQLLFISEEVVPQELQQNLNEIHALYIQLNMEKTKSDILKEVALEVIYSKFITNNKSLAAFKVMDLFSTAFEHLNLLKGKDLVLFLGGTGAGKSSAINFYLGHELEMMSRFGKDFTKLKDENALLPGTYAKIGQSVACSETTFVQGYQVREYENEDTRLCDFPGFDDTRGEYVDLTTAVSIDQAIQCARSVKSIVLVLPYDAFFVNR